MSRAQRTTEEPSDETKTPEVSDHAVLRFRQRINSAEPFPRAAIEGRLARASPRGSHPQVHGGLAWVADDAVLVTDSSKETVLTVLRRREGRR